MYGNWGPYPQPGPHPRPAKALFLNR